MNRVTKVVLDVVLYVIVFLVVQLIVQFLGAGIYAAVMGTEFQMIMAGMVTGDFSGLLVLLNFISSVITLLIFALAKWTPLEKEYMASKPWGALFWVVLFTVGTILPLQWIYDQTRLIMPEHYERLFEGIMAKPYGYLSIGILAPLVEEMVFRGAVLRRLLEVLNGKWHWVSIFISAFLFGAVHGNLAQFVHAFILGCVIGWMYYRTRSIAPGVVLHWVNNTVAYVMFYVMPQAADGKLIDLFHGNNRTMLLAIGFSLCILLPSLLQLVLRLRPDKQG